MGYSVVNFHIDTLLVNVQGQLPEAVFDELDELQRKAKELEDDIATPYSFLGQTMYLKPHGSGKQWRFILYCGDSNYLHIDIGKGKLNNICAKARFSSLLLHEHGSGEALTLVHGFLVNLLGEGYTLQVSEVHICADISGWELTTRDIERFVTRSRTKQTRTESSDDDDEPVCTWDGRKLKQIDFSKTAPHSCSIYDKTKQVKRQHKEWFYEVWRGQGWDGEATITRVEFRYERECLREMGMECPYEMLDQLPAMWAYSAQKWLRHTEPSEDTNQSRWEDSTVWQVVQAASGYEDATPAVREKKIELDSERAKAGFVGFATSWAVRAVALHVTLAEARQHGLTVLMGPQQDKGLPLQAVDEDGGGFLAWAYEGMQAYLAERKAASFVRVMQDKAARLGLPLAA